jgi:hypothetical protein
MSEQRFYIRHLYTCPECMRPLEWQTRRGSRDSMMLVHPKFDPCSKSEKKYYAPGVDLTELILLPEG